MLQAIDESLAAVLTDGRTDFLDAAFGSVTHAGDWWFLVGGGLAIVVFLLVRGREKDAVVVAGSLVLGLGGLLQAVKWIVDRARPIAQDAVIEQPASGSFPSGHAFGIVLVAGLAVWVTWEWRRTLIWRVGAAFAILLALAVGASRVYLGVHWPSDIVAGWLLGVVWLGATVSVSRVLARTSAPEAG